jgi:carboxypeptidase PM20D1
MKQPMKSLFKYRSLFRPLILKELIKSSELAATVRTTSVMTMAEGSKAPNVLAQSGRVNINCRIVPGDSVEKVLARIKARINPLVTIVAHNPTEPTIVSPSDNNQFKLIQNALAYIYPDIKAIAPYLMVAATDSRIYHDMAEGVYRVQPFMNMLWDRGTLHADNERIELESFIKGISFFKQLIINGSKVE